MILDNILYSPLNNPAETHHQFPGGVNVWDSNDLDQVAATVSHELGHNLGLDHDTLLCSQECPGPGGCLMSPSAVSDKSTRWSSCSRDDLLTAYRRGLDYCLRNLPQQVTLLY